MLPVIIYMYSLILLPTPLHKISILRTFKHYLHKILTATPTLKKNLKVFMSEINSD